MSRQLFLGREFLTDGLPVRLHVHAHHLLVYRVVEQGIELIRVLHKNMNVDWQ